MNATSSYFQLEWAIQLSKENVTKEDPEFVAQESILSLAESMPWNLFLVYLKVV
jgi:hypothetical protein